MNEDLHISTWSFNRYLDPAFLISSALVVLAAAASWFYPGWLAVFFLILTLAIWGVIVYFFRDPDRQPFREPGLVVGPADGVVVGIEPFEESRYLNTQTLRVSMFLSLWDVHVQRAPLGGSIKLVEHQPGKFLQAFREEASEVNEYIAMVIETDFGGIKFGSRVDLFLPPDAEVLVKVGDKVSGGLTRIAQLQGGEQ